MTRRPVTHLMLALALAVILPLEQAHCVTMALGSHSASSSACASRPCCSGAAASLPAHSQRPAASPSCVCELLPAGTLPATVSAGATVISFAAIAADEARELIPAPASDRQIAPAPDVGSPPLPAALGAHLLRAPPVSA